MERGMERERVDRVLDPLIAMAIITFGLIDIWLLSPSELYTFEGSNTAHSLLLLATCAPLAVRRRAPVAAATVVVVAGYVWYYALGTLTTTPPVELFAAVLIAAYTIGAFTSGRRFVFGVGALLLMIPVEIPALLAGRPVGDTVPAWLFTGVFVTVGRFVQYHRGMATRLRQQTHELEQEHADNARLAAALERTRLARELHDVVTHNVSLMVIQASVERRSLTDENARPKDVLGSIEDLGRETLGELRRLVGVMRADGEGPALSPQPTLAQLPDLVARTREAGLAVDLVIEGAARYVPVGIGLAAYRIVQEALTNTLKHSSARNVQVLVRYEPAQVDVEIRDDGQSASVSATMQGNGLDGMRERAQLYGGSLDAAPAPDGGFRVAATLPTDEGVP